MWQNDGAGAQRRCCSAGSEGGGHVPAVMLRQASAQRVGNAASTFFRPRCSQSPSGWHRVWLAGRWRRERWCLAVTAAQRQGRLPTRRGPTRVTRIGAAPSRQPWRAHAPCCKPATRGRRPWSSRSAPSSCCRRSRWSPSSCSRSHGAEHEARRSAPHGCGPGTPACHRNARRHRHPLVVHEAWLTVEGGDAGTLPLDSRLVRIGRHQDNDVRLPDTTVHRYHAVIERTAGRGIRDHRPERQGRQRHTRQRRAAVTGPVDRRRRHRARPDTVEIRECTGLRGPNRLLGEGEDHEGRKAHPRRAARRSRTDRCRTAFWGRCGMP